MAHLLPQNNVCLFADPSPVREGAEHASAAGEATAAGEALFPFRFVYETMPAALTYPRHHPWYTCHLMTEGNAILHTDTGDFPLSAGDLFFILQGEAYTLTDCRFCKYFYIAFTGSGIPELLRRYGIQSTRPVFPGHGELTDLWLAGLGKCREENLSTLAKGLLYYTFALLPSPTQMQAQPAPVADNLIEQICQVIQKSYGSCELSLAYICRLYNYHPKYISRRFHEVLGKTFTEYLTEYRMTQARTLLRDTECSIQEVASAVGYANALYFSRVFRKCIGLSPTAWREAGQVEDGQGEG